MNVTICNTKLNAKLNLSFDAWKLSTGNKTEIIQIELKSGECIDTHSNPLDVQFYVISGSGIITVEGINYEVKGGDCFYVPKNILRKWENISSEKLISLVIKELP
jgi:quercetin dioxygenase-like cupin family protein